jgi:chromosome segregation ATPase
VLAECVAERDPLRAQLTDAERCGEERESVIARLREGLAVAERLLAERDEEIARLRAGLSHAEALAFERERELEELHRPLLGKFKALLMRMKPRRRPQSPA